MSGAAEPHSLVVMLRLDGPQAQARALLALLAQSRTLQVAALTLPAAPPGVAREVWQSRAAEAPLELHGLRFQAGPVCAYVTQQAGQPAQVEFEVFAEEPCTLERVLDELPALVAILHDPGFQTAAGWPGAQPGGAPC